MIVLRQVRHLSSGDPSQVCREQCPPPPPPLPLPWLENTDNCGLLIMEPGRGGHVGSSGLPWLLTNGDKSRDQQPPDVIIIHNTTNNKHSTNRAVNVFPRYFHNTRRRPLLGPACAHLLTPDGPGGLLVHQLEGLPRLPQLVLRQVARHPQLSIYYLLSTVYYLLSTAHCSLLALSLSNTW